MNRPAVRNVRALRTERELDRARQAHAQGRERRRVAASHRGIVASVLLGVSLGAWADHVSFAALAEEAHGPDGAGFEQRLTRG